MQIYLPIAEMSMNIYILLGLGFFIGILSGLFGIGGGFLLTPMLIFLGIPAPVAVATLSNQIAAQSLVGLRPHLQRRNVDMKMGGVLLIGGLLGSTLGVIIFSILRKLGQIDLFINFLYVLCLGFIGTTMFIESLNTLRKTRSGQPLKRKTHHFGHKLPMRIRFRESGLYMSIFLPLGVSFFIGLISALMGIGGGFILVPAMIYIIGIPTRVVIGTSLFQIIFVSANVTMLQAYSNQTVDVVLALILLIGGAFGVTLGSKLSLRLRAVQLRILLALVILLVAIKILTDMTFSPPDIYEMRFIERILT